MTLPILHGDEQLAVIDPSKLPEPQFERSPMSRASSFWGRVAVGGPDECWPWTASLNGGYGRPTFGRKAYYAHRLAYELVIGPVPAGLEIDHLCRNTACCNPAHLEPVTKRENNLRGESPAAQNARRTTCKHGHPLVMVIECGRERRRCKTCYATSQREYARRHRAAAKAA